MGQTSVNVTDHATLLHRDPMRTGGGSLGAGHGVRRQGGGWWEGLPRLPREARAADFDASGGGARRRFEVGARIQNIERIDTV